MSKEESLLGLRTLEDLSVIELKHSQTSKHAIPSEGPTDNPLPPTTQTLTSCASQPRCAAKKILAHVQNPSGCNCPPISNMARAYNPTGLEAERSVVGKPGQASPPPHSALGVLRSAVPAGHVRGPCGARAGVGRRHGRCLRTREGGGFLGSHSSSVFQ